jgi:hypothetical protein
MKCVLLYAALMLMLRIIPRRIGNIMAPFEPVQTRIRELPDKRQ